MVVNALLTLSELNYHRGNLDKAYQYFREYSKIKEEIYSETITSKINEMEIRFETEKKENRILRLTKERQTQKKIKNLLIAGVGMLTLIVILLLHGFLSRSKANRIIKQKNNELNELVALKNKFFSIISHDLKNGFVSLDAGTEILIDEMDRGNYEEVRMVSQEVRKASHNLYQFLENLLEWSRLQTSKIEYRPSLIKVEEELAPLLHMFTKSAQRKGIVFHSTIERDMQVNADANVLKSIILNLVSNAIKFTPTGGQVDLTIRQKEEMAEMVVKDSGIGMTEAEMGNLFKVDIAHNKRGTANEEGTGLGLIICRDYLEMMNGGIAVESKVGGGSTFTVTIPVAE